MSEEILKALMQLFAIISKQSDSGGMNNLKYVREFLKQQIAADKVPVYLELYNSFLNEGESKPSALTSVKDSVKTLSICKKINKTLSHKQKIIVLFRICEFINSGTQIDKLQKEITETVAKVFNVDRAEFLEILYFTSIKSAADLTDQENCKVLIDKKENPELTIQSVIHKEGLHGFFLFFLVKSSNTILFRFFKEQNVLMNGLAIFDGKGYVLTQGATVRTSKGVIYFNEIINYYNEDSVSEKIVFDAVIPQHSFKGNKIALRSISIHEESGTLFGIMGASGAGKTTLLNILSGLEPSKLAQITINGFPINSNEARGSIGYIPQDDLLMEELTVYQNLYYNAKLCNRSWTNAEIVRRVIKVLNELGLSAIRDIKVGNALNKKISGGQRKRLNIALELIREPAVLFVDEPTSGLSSRDSENVVDLLKQLSQGGKIIFVVIHQPSSEIYKLFDKMFILDTGGFPVYYGNAIEAVIYFKTITSQINKEIGECISCGNVNPELIFNTIEDKEIDEFGNYTAERKITAERWNEYYKENHAEVKRDIQNLPLKNSKPPGKFKQLRVFFIRDFLSRISDSQYILIALLEAPILSFILSIIIRKSTNNDELGYIYYYNQNIPAYIFMLVIVSLFVGLSISAEEIFKDRKIIKRESFLRLSRFSYINSKMLYLIFLSSIQSSLFCLIGNWIVEINGMLLWYWLMSFSVFVFGNISGLILSSSFNSIVTIYVIIPIIIIPQMILGGAMFRYDNLSKIVGGGNHVPFIADMMISRWGYEGLMVAQFRYNDFEDKFFEHNQLLSKYNYRTTYLLPKLNDLLEEKRQSEEITIHSIVPTVVSNTLKREYEIKNQKKVLSEVNWDKLNYELADSLINDLKSDYQKKYNILSAKKDMLIVKYDKKGEGGKIAELKLLNGNESIDEIVLNTLSKEKGYIEDELIFQNMDQVYLMDHLKTDKIFSENPMFVPYKKAGGTILPTFWFNLIVIWFFTLIGYLILYFDLLKKLINLKLK